VERPAAGYGAYLALYELCRQKFPGISDPAIAKMVSGINVVALCPDDAAASSPTVPSSSILPTRLSGGGRGAARRSTLQARRR
jgi:hypothetical protein